MGTEWFPVNDMNEEHLVSFGARLREERERLRLNQTAFAATGGVTKKTQMLYESGERAPDARYLAAVHEIGADVRYIVTGLRDAPPADPMSADEQQLLGLFRAAPLALKAAAIGALSSGVTVGGGISVGGSVVGQVAQGGLTNERAVRIERTKGRK